MTHRAGWKTVRARLERHLPEIFHQPWISAHLENHAHLADRVTRAIGKFGMIYEILAGRQAAQNAIRAGATRILVATYNNAPWLPAAKGVRFFIYGDATLRQLNTLGYGKKNHSISKLAKTLYDSGFKRQVARGHHFICWSRWYADALKSEHGVPESQISVVPPFVDCSKWIPRSGPRKNGPLRIIFVGAAFQRKGGDLLVQAIHHPALQEVEWHLVTKSPPSPVPPNVHCYTHFDGDANGLVSLMQDSDLFVLPTLADCSPLACLEAAASGVPSIITRIAGTPDLVDDGKTGVLLPNPPQLDDLVAAILTYLQNPERLLSHGAAARAKALAEFDAHVVFEQFQKIMGN